MTTKIEQEVATLRLAEAISFFAVTMHRNERGEPVATMTVIADDAAQKHADEFHEARDAMAAALRKAYARTR